MLRILRSQAAVVYRRLYFLAKDINNPSVAKTGLVFAAADVQVSVNGGAAANSGGAVTELDATNFPGVYYYTFTENGSTGEVDAYGFIAVRIKHASMVEQTHIIQIVATDDYDPTPDVNLAQWLNSTPNALQTGRVDAYVGAMAANVVTSTAIASNAITSAKIAASAIGASQIATGAITSTKFATDAIDSNALAASAVAEIQSGLATAAAVAAIPTNPLLTTDVRLNNLDATISSRSTLTAANVWQYAIEGAFTAEQLMRGYVSALFGKASGFDGATRTFRDLADTKDRIVAAVDATGRTAITLNLT